MTAPDRLTDLLHRSADPDEPIHISATSGLPLAVEAGLAAELTPQFHADLRELTHQVVVSTRDAVRRTETKFNPIRRGRPLPPPAPPVAPHRPCEFCRPGRFAIGSPVLLADEDVGAVGGPLALARGNVARSAAPVSAVVFADSHDPLLTAAEFEALFEAALAYAWRVRRVAGPLCLSLFGNMGPHAVRAGGSIAHPHIQLVGTPHPLPARDHPPGYVQRLMAQHARLGLLVPFAGGVAWADLCPPKEHGFAMLTDDLLPGAAMLHRFVAAFAARGGATAWNFSATPLVDEGGPWLWSWVDRSGGVTSDIGALELLFRCAVVASDPCDTARVLRDAVAPG